MKIKRKISISTPAADVWKVLGDDFVTAHVWMAGIKSSVEITDGQRIDNAPAIGRRAEIGVNPGSFMDEVISAYDPEAMTLTVKTTLVNTPKGTPLKGFDTDIAVRSLGDRESEVTWESRARLHPLGYVLYPVLKKGLSSGFLRSLEEIKCFVETGKPHQRRIDTAAKWA